MLLNKGNSQQIKKMGIMYKKYTLKINVRII